MLVLYVLASATVGFAHRLPMPSAPNDLAQYALPDGTLPFICSPNTPGEGEKNRLGVPFCDACRLIAAPGLVLPSFAVLPLQTTWIALVRPLQQVRVKLARAVATLGARGPPLA